MSDPNPPPVSSQPITLGDNVQAYQPLEPDFSELQMATVTLNFDGSPVDDDELRRGFELTGLTAEEKKLKNLKRKRAVEYIELAKRIEFELKEGKKKARKDEDEEPGEKWEDWKQYWNLILNTFFFTMDKIENKDVDIEKVEFHEMLVNIYEFDKGADWEKYELWSVPYLIYNLFGPFEAWEEFNDTEYFLYRSLKLLGDRDTHKKNVKRVLAYLHHCQSHRSEETRTVYGLSLEFESQLFDWILCSLQNNLEKYVDAQEKLRGKMAPQPKYHTSPTFMDRLKYYETRKNQDVKHAFLYECYEFFKYHAHIESEVLNADFQELWTRPMQSERSVELEYFRKVLGLDAQNRITF